MGKKEIQERREKIAGIMEKAGDTEEDSSFDFSMEDFRKKEEEERDRQIKELSAASRPLNELVESCEFVVERVYSENKDRQIPIGEPIIGGRNYSSSTGYQTKLTLELAGNNFGIKRLIFDGNSGVRGGDSIRALVPKYEERKIEDDSYGCGCCGDRKKTFYLPREKFGEEEEAVEIEVLTASKKILRVDRAIEYRNFMKN